MKKRTLIALSALFILAFVLRILYLPKLSLSFHYDMARDAYVVKQILGGDLKILGPPASTPGLFHGVFYYYLLTPAYFFGGGSPIAASYWLAFLNSLGVFLIFYLSLLVSKNRQVSMLASFLYAVSFGVVQYATWLSNPSIAVWTVPIIYLGLWAWLKPSDVRWGRKFGPVITALGLGLSIHSEIFLGYHTIPIIIWLWIARKKITKIQLSKFVGIFVVVISSLILAEIKFGFKGVQGIQSIFFGEDVFVKFRSLGDFVVLYLNQIGKLYSLTLFPANIGYGGFFGIGLLIFGFLNWNKGKKRPFISWPLFLIIYSLSHLFIVTLGGTSTPFVTAGLEASILILSAIFIIELMKKNKKLGLGLLALLVVANVSVILRENKEGQTNFVIQKDMVLANQVPAIDYTYQEAEGKPFSINTLTSPLWINTTWSYLYNWYGLKEYGYLPEWRGRDQIGQLGNNLVHAADETRLHFFIIEPMQGIPEKYLNLELGAEESRSKLVEEKNFQGIRVQKRLMDTIN